MLAVIDQGPVGATRDTDSPRDIASARLNAIVLPISELLNTQNGSFIEAGTIDAHIGDVAHLAISTNYPCRNVVWP